MGDAGGGEGVGGDRHSGAARRAELGCAIAHARISRFRVWSFGPSRNDLEVMPHGWNRKFPLAECPERSYTLKIALKASFP